MQEREILPPKEFKPYIIRKGSCGHWVAFKFIDLGILITFTQIAHCETFDEMLVLWNVTPEDYI